MGTSPLLASPSLPPSQSSPALTPAAGSLVVGDHLARSNSSFGTAEGRGRSATRPNKLVKKRSRSSRPGLVRSASSSASALPAVVDETGSPQSPVESSGGWWTGRGRKSRSNTMPTGESAGAPSGAVGMAGGAAGAAGGGGTVAGDGASTAVGAISDVGGSKGHRTGPSADFEWVTGPAGVPADNNSGNDGTPLRPAASRSSSASRRARALSPRAMFSRSSRSRSKLDIPASPPPAPSSESYTLPSLNSAPEMLGLERYQDPRVGGGTMGSPPGKARILGGATGPAAFHKPSSLIARENGAPLPTLPTPNKAGKGPSIASLYAKSDFTPHSVPWDLGSQAYRSHPPTPTSATRSLVGAYPQLLRKSQRVPPAFNVMVAGPSGTGKTSFLRTLLSTSRLSASTAQARDEEMEAVRGFGVARTKEVRKRLARTEKSESMKATVVSENGEKVALTVIDSAGFDWPLDDLRVDMAINSMIRLIESRFDETLSLESQVHRNPQRAGDSHVHLVLYFIHPTTVNSQPARPPPHLRPSTTNSVRVASPDKRGSEDREEGRLRMSEVDLRQIKRLSRRANVLPVIARADELTDDRLFEVKAAVLRDLKAAGIRWGVFEPERDEEEDEETPEAEPDRASPGDESGVDEAFAKLGESNGSAPDVVMTAPESAHSTSMDESPATPPRPPKSPRRQTSSSFSSNHPAPPAPRTPRGSLSVPATKGKRRGSNFTQSPSLSTSFLDSEDIDSSPDHGGPSSPPFEDLLPFALIAPERSAEIGPSGEVQEEGEHEFVRTYRWGKVDVLDQKHCDFSTLKRALLGSHMKLLKDATRHTHYEQYRSERLLASSRTTADERRRFRQEVESIQIPSSTTIRLGLDDHAVRSSFSSHSHSQGHAPDARPQDGGHATPLPQLPMASPARTPQTPPTMPGAFFRRDT